MNENKVSSSEAESRMCRASPDEKFDKAGNARILGLGCLSGLLVSTAVNGVRILRFCDSPMQPSVSIMLGAI